MKALEYLQSLGTYTLAETEEEALNVLIDSHKYLRQKNLEELKQFLALPRWKMKILYWMKLK